MGCLEKGTKVVKASEQCTGEKQAEENRGKTGKMWLVLFESCSVHMSSQHSLSCLPFQLCFWWFSQGSPPYLLCPSAEVPSALAPTELGPRASTREMRARGLDVPARTRAGPWRGEEGTVRRWQSHTGGPLRRARALPAGGYVHGVCVPALPLAIPALPHNVITDMV